MALRAFASQVAGAPPDLQHLLLHREKHVLKHLFTKYQERHHSNPAADQDLVIHLGDNACRACWSGVSNRIPTFRTGGRWLTGREKMSCLGLPIDGQVAAAMGVPPLQVSDTARAHHVSGNSMNFSTVGVIQLVALCCFTKTNAAYPLLDMYKQHERV